MVSFNYSTTVYYKDIDQMGIVYYSRYFEFFEAARTKLLASIDLTVTDIELLGVYLPVVHAECNYIEGAKFEDNLIVKTVIRELPKLRLVIDYAVVKTNNTKELVTGQSTHVFINQKTSKPVRPPKQVIEKLKPFFNLNKERQ